MIDLIVSHIETYLQEHRECREHDLIQYLKQVDCTPYNELELSNNKDLFDLHFLTRHALYLLQAKYSETKGYCLDIGLVHIRLTDYSSSLQNTIAPQNNLRAYYLNLDHYLETTEKEVDSLLNNFWEKYLAQGDRQEALLVLELPYDADYETIKSQYRKLAQKHHPDKGGEALKFAAIAEAKAVLDRCFK